MKKFWRKYVEDDMFAVNVNILIAFGATVIVVGLTAYLNH